jgi:tetratricopeptide (TPR) repeat protein
MRRFIAALFLVCAFSRTKVVYGSGSDPLPQIDTSNFLPVVRTQIEQAAATARAHPDDPQAVGMLAMTLHAYQQYRAAALAYSRAHQLDPRKFDWLYLSGAARMELGDIDAARELLQSAAALEPGNLATQLRLAQALRGLNRHTEAAALYKQILEKHPENPQAWYGLGRIQAAQGDHAAAAESYAQACQLFPDYGAAHFAAAQELRILGKPDAARQQMNAYTAHPATEPLLDDPLFARIAALNHGPQVHMQRAAEFEKAGKFEDAINEEKAALRADATNVQAHVNLISLYGRMGDSGNAKQHFDEAIHLDPNRADAWYNLGVLLLSERNVAESEKAFRRALEINPDYAEAHYDLGVICEQQVRLDDAAREFGAAVSARPDYPEARFRLGRIFVNRQNYDAAIYQFAHALEPESDHTPTYLYALAATYARAGRRPEALQFFEKAREAARALGQEQLLASIERDLRNFSSQR